MFLQSPFLPPQPFQRIVSLVPSQTELLYHLGLGERVAGITKFCVHPKEWLTSKTIVGGTKNVNIELVRKLRPDLIIVNKEENVKEQVGMLAEGHAVWMTDVKDLKSALAMIEDVGLLTGASREAGLLVKEITAGFAQMRLPGAVIPAAYLIWRDPFMAAGGDTFINDMLSRCGFHNIFSRKTRYPEITIAQLREQDCQLLFLSSEPYPFKEKHVLELQTALPDTKVVLVDGELFSWYGSRLLKAPAYFADLLKKGGAGYAIST